MFGILGIIIGPIIAALFMTVWDIYGDSFKDYLPKVGSALKDLVAEPPAETDKSVAENSDENSG
jgi:hypothetical protein